MSFIRNAAFAGFAAFMTATPAMALTLPVEPASTFTASVADEAQYRGDRMMRRGRMSRQVCTIRTQRVVTRSGRVISRPVQVCRTRPGRF